MTIIAVIDRIEGDLAVLSYDGAESTFDIPASLLPEGAQEGASVHLSCDLITSDISDTTEQVALRLQRLAGDTDPGGDFSL